MSAGARSASTCRSTCSSPTTSSRQVVVVTKDLEARDRLQAQAREAARARSSPSAVARVYPLELGPPVGWPVQYRVSGPDMQTVREHRAAARRDRRPRTRIARTSTSTGTSRPGSCAQRRPGQGAPARRHLAGIASVLNTVVSGHDRHPGARRHLPRSTWWRAPGRASACRSRRCAPCRSRCRAGGTVPLRAVRHLRLRARNSRWSGGATGCRRSPCRPTSRRRRCPRPSWSAARSPRIDALRATLPAATRRDRRHGRGERASRRPRSSPWCRSCCFIMLTVLMVQLQSFQRLFLVLSVAPLGLIGVVAALLLFRRAAGLRRDPRHPGADRHDHPQLGDPDRPDRGRPRGRAGDAGTR